MCLWQGNGLTFVSCVVLTSNPICKYCFGEPLTFDPYCKRAKISSICIECRSKKVISRNIIHEMIKYITGIQLTFKTDYVLIDLENTNVHTFKLDLIFLRKYLLAFITLSNGGGVPHVVRRPSSWHWLTIGT